MCKLHAPVSGWLQGLVRPLVATYFAAGKLARKSKREQEAENDTTEDSKRVRKPVLQLSRESPHVIMLQKLGRADEQKKESREQENDLCPPTTCVRAVEWHKREQQATGKLAEEKDHLGPGSDLGWRRRSRRRQPKSRRGEAGRVADFD